MVGGLQTRKDDDGMKPAQARACILRWLLGKKLAYTAQDLADASGRRRAADEAGGDDVELEAGAGLGRRGVQARREHEARREHREPRLRRHQSR